MAQHLHPVLKLTMTFLALPLARGEKREAHVHVDAPCVALNTSEHFLLAMHVKHVLMSMQCKAGKGAVPCQFR